MVEEDIQTALILEDDADWDIRIHQQMTDFAKATRVLVQPKHQINDEYHDPTIKTPAVEGQAPALLVAGAHYIRKPTTSPYGDTNRWDMFWVGHCGTALPEPGDNIPTARAVILNDTTLPEWHHVASEFSRDEKYKEDFPDHTRIVFRTAQNVCTLGYALTQQGARRIVYDMGIREMTGTADWALQAFCLGSDGRPARTCLSVQPQYFQHHRSAGPISHSSDISTDGWEFGYREVPSTQNIKLSTHVNLPKLVAKEKDYIENYKDGEYE